ncbi:lytic transglycosylase domain-containing protein [Sphingorhabdus wooponensis]|uniref:Lytic transglycosylase domain-containing protein n=1 Tax=Sphingorhabdus wooponensis TaxID=940136 RepID=A0A426RSW2_9SPHN|nr:lytic transglycosylase domain-containing protein [Sphingorhabdus wooponensis]RRQ51996.1 lytic transglycosylase domain-containing protein [Sphingorhabdus wooponensis]
MSSMVKHLISASILIIPFIASASTPKQDAIIWQSGTGAGQVSASSGQPLSPPVIYDPSEGKIPAALQRWKMLSAPGNFSFNDYASFLMLYPDWPNAEDMRKKAEQAINPVSYSPNQVVAFFDRLPPVTNEGRAKFALALDTVGDKARAEAQARVAWRGGPLNDEDEARVFRIARGTLNAADHDARVDRLLWSGSTRSAERWISLTSPQRRPAFLATLAMRVKAPDADVKVQEAGVLANSEASLLAARADAMRTAGNGLAVRELLANRGNLVAPAPVLKDWYQLLLTHARAAENDGQYDVAYRIASRVDDAVPNGLVMSDQDLATRDRYTSLTWLAGSIAMDHLGRPRDAVTMFERYATAARTAQTRSRGLYWAGKAAAKTGDQSSAVRYFEQAAAFYESFFGQLALEQLRRPLPQVPRVAATPPVLTNGNVPAIHLAAALAAKYGSWRDQSNFFRAIARHADDREEYVAAIGLSQKLGRPDLAVMAGRAARTDGIPDLLGNSYPTVNIPAAHSQTWTLAHAIMRQESQFDRAAVSHAGARGLMQLMPGTARETSGKIAMAYRPDALTVDTDYNIALGATYIERMLDYYDGSYPLAIAAYNGGPGNVNKWLRAFGDPRTGSIDIMDWIEKIPLSETRDYVYRVLENAVMYDHLHPDKARVRSATPLSTYLGKSTPG